MGMNLNVRPLREEDRELVRAMTEQSFALSAAHLDLHASTPLDESWVITCDGTVQGALRVERVGQFFGGVSVPCAAISAVQVVPAWRGRGLGRTLMQEVFAELRSAGLLISTLYPATVGSYRRLGYEFAGAYTRYRLPLTALPSRRIPTEVEPCDGESRGTIASCYHRHAKRSTGMLDRTERWWTRRVFNESTHSPVYCYRVGPNSGLGAYVIYTQEPAPSDFGHSYDLVCRDLIWHDVDGAEALLGLLAAHPVVGVELKWPGPIEEPLFGFIDALQIRIERSSRSMTRLVDVTGALETRSYPPHLQVAVDLRVEDPIISANAGVIRLSVSGGVGKVTTCRTARAAVDVGALAAMYTGWLPAREAARAGRLKDAAVDDVETLEAIFAGPKPWMLDIF